MAQVKANGIDIEYTVEGNGDPLVLIGGLSMQLIDFPQPFVDLLVAAGFKVIRFDNRDAGLSTEFSGPGMSRRDLVKALARRPVRSQYTIGDMAADTAALLEALDVGPAHVVGMSMGGMIAQELTIGWPEAVSSLTSIMSHTGDKRHGLIDPKLAVKVARLGDPDPSDPAAMREDALQTWRWISGPATDDALIVAQVEAAIARSIRVEGTARQSAAIFASRDRTTALHAVRTPTLVIHGLVDPLVRPSGGVTTAKAVPGARLLMFPDMGHDLPPTRWAEMVEAIRRNADRAALPA